MIKRPTKRRIHHEDKIIKSLITPNRKEGQNATFNPAVWPEIIPEQGCPILTRFQKKSNKSITSETVLGYLTTPTKLSTYQKTILSTKKPYATKGHEDTRIYKHNGTYYLTSIAFDGKNPRVVEHTTKNLEEKIKYNGIIGPQIPLKKAIQIVGENSHYGKAWKRHIDTLKPKQLLSIKDASKIYIPNKNGKYKPGLIIRADPHIQLIIAENEKDFKREDFWENEIEHLEERTILTKEQTQAKIGIGSPPTKVNGKHIGTYHIVEKEKQGKISIYRYYGSFYEFNPETNKITSRIRNPLFRPTTEYPLVEQNKNGKIECIKFVNFPTGIIPNQENDDLYTYLGHGDKLSDVYITSIKWVCEQLDKNFNKKNIIDLSLANIKQQKRK